MRKAAILILMAAVMGGCGSTHAKRYFQIRSIAPDEPALPKVERRLLVEPASVDPLYDDIRIPFRISAFELSTTPMSSGRRDRAGRSGTAMAEFLVKKKVFPSVGVGGKGLNESPDIVLRSGIHVLEEIDNPRGWEARLAMTIEFVDARTGATIVARNLTGRSRCSSKSAICRRRFEDRRRGAGQGRLGFGPRAREEVG